jgi:hypothetical protein
LSVSKKAHTLGNKHKRESKIDCIIPLCMKELKNNNNNKGNERKTNTSWICKAMIISILIIIMRRVRLGIDLKDQKAAMRNNNMA